MDMMVAVYMGEAKACAFQRLYLHVQLLGDLFFNGCAAVHKQLVGSGLFHKTPVRARKDPKAPGERPPFGDVTMDAEGDL